MRPSLCGFRMPREKAGFLQICAQTQLERESWSACVQGWQANYRGILRDLGTTSQGG